LLTHNEKTPMRNFNTKTWPIGSRIKHTQLPKFRKCARHERLTLSAFVAKVLDEEVQRREK